MTKVAIELPDDLGRFVEQSVASGAFQSSDEFFVSVLSTFKEQVEAPLNEEEQGKLEMLRGDIGVAVDQFDRGEGIRDFDWEGFIAERHQKTVGRG